MNEKGFSLAPRGHLLDQILETDQEMGLAYERSVGFYKEYHSHTRDILVFPRGACRMQVRQKGEQSPFQISSGELLFIPKGVVHDDLSRSTVYDTIALLPSEKFMLELAVDNEISPRDMKSLRSKTHLLVRTRWMNGLIERYVYERIVSHSRIKNSLFYLEKQILNEFVRMLYEDETTQVGSEERNRNNLNLAPALRKIESSLFEDIDVEQLARAAACSKAKLLRDFKNELGTTPGRYIRDRRLDEAARLLEQGVESIGNIAILVGYEDLSAFTRAFRKRFDATPKDYREQRASIR